MNLNKLKDRVHENAIKHSAWNGKKSMDEYFALIHYEISLTLEVDINGYWFIKKECASYLFDWIEIKYDDNYIKDFLEGFRNNIKNTFEDKLADVVIRTLDLCGYYEIDIDKIINKCEIDNLFKHAKSMAGKLLILHNLITYAQTNDNGYRPGNGKEYDESSIVRIIMATLELAKQLNINIEKHIKMSIRYNENKERSD